MELIETTEGASLGIELVGRLDSNTAKLLEDRLLGLIDAGATAIVLDFGRLDYISSAGLRVLLMAAKKCKATQGKLVLCAMQPHVREVFDLSGFSKIFAIRRSREG